MSDKRKNTSDTLRKMSADFTKDSPSQEDLEDARHFQLMATKNDNGTLTIGEAKMVSDYLEEENPLIVDTGGERWVETD